MLFEGEKMSKKDKEIYEEPLKMYRQKVDDKIVILQQKLKKNKSEGKFEEQINFCPICGGDEEVLTGHSGFDELFKKNRYEYYCNVCKEEFIIFIRSDFGD